MLDRVLRNLLNLVVLGLIVATAATSVVTGYTGFTLLVRAHPGDAGWLLAACLLTGLTASTLLRHREDLSYC
jgi:hypothetical protein